MSSIELYLMAGVDMKIFGPSYASGPVERSNAGGGGGCTADVHARATTRKTYDEVFAEAKPIDTDEARPMQIDCNELWFIAYGVIVPYDFRWFLMQIALSVSLSRDKLFAKTSRALRRLEKDVTYPIPMRSLQNWRERGSGLSYFSVVESEVIGYPSYSGRDTCIYFTQPQKDALMKATGVC